MVFENMNASQFGELTADAISYLSASQLSTIGSICGTLTPEKVLMLSLHSTDACTGITIQCLSAISSQYYGNLRPSCVQLIPDLLFGEISVDALLNMSRYAIGTMSSAKLLIAVEAYQYELIGGYSYEQLSEIPLQNIWDFQELFERSITNVSRMLNLCDFDQSSVTWLSIFFSENSSLSCLNNETFATMTAIQLAGFSDYHASDIGGDSFSGLTSDHVGGLSPLLVSALDSEQFGYFSCSSFAGLSDRFFNISINGTLENITPRQISGLKGTTSVPSCQNFMAYLSLEQRKMLNSSNVSFKNLSSCPVNSDLVGRNFTKADLVACDYQSHSHVKRIPKHSSIVLIGVLIGLGILIVASIVGFYIYKRRQAIQGYLIVPDEPLE